MPLCHKAQMRSVATDLIDLHINQNSLQNFFTSPTIPTIGVLLMPISGSMNIDLNELNVRSEFAAESKRPIQPGSKQKDGISPGH